MSAMQVGKLEDKDNTVTKIKGQILLENVNVEDIESAVYSRPNDGADTGEGPAMAILTAIRRLKCGANFIGYQQDTVTLRRLYTRLCSAIVALFADPKFSLSPEGFSLFAAEHATFGMLFSAAYFGSSDHLLLILRGASGGISQGQKLELQGPQLAKLLVVHAPPTAFTFKEENLFKADPKGTFALWLGALASASACSTESHARREKLLELHHLFEGQIIPPSCLQAASDAYMYCSYASRPDKHDMKATIQRCLAISLAASGVKLPSESRIRRRLRSAKEDLISGEKPTVLFCSEWFTSLHAMYRCYVPMVRALRKEFKVVCASRASDIDDEALKEFDGWIEVPPLDISLADLATKIDEIAPSVVWYPSLGMAMWWVALASVRLAPVQFVTLGHPATSGSPAIDYVLAEEGAAPYPELFCEKIMTVPLGTCGFAERADAAHPEPRDASIRLESAPFVVAIPAMALKLGAPFMEAMVAFNNLCENKGIKTEFRFFSNVSGLQLEHVRLSVQSWIPSAKVYGRMGYRDYQNELRLCDVHASTFPFGGTNSVMDSLRLGVPVVCLEGNQPHERFDAMILRRVTAPSWMITYTPDDYISSMFKLAASPKLLSQVSAKLADFDYLGEFFSAVSPDKSPMSPGSIFSDAVKKMIVDKCDLSI